MRAQKKSVLKRPLFHLTGVSLPQLPPVFRQVQVGTVGSPHSQERVWVGLRLCPPQQERKAVSSEENLELGLPGWCSGLNEKCPRRAFEHLVPSWWYCLRNLWLKVETSLWMCVPGVCEGTQGRNCPHDCSMIWLRFLLWLRTVRGI